MHLRVSAGDREIYTIVDPEDVVHIGKRRLSLGSHGYAQVTGVETGRVVLLHRWLMGARKGDGRIVDHINRNRLDNRHSNLRFVTPGQSSANVTPHGISGFRGVYAMRDKWQAKGKVNGKIYYLGTFETPEEAAVVAREWRIENLPGYVTDRRAA